MSYKIFYTVDGTEESVFVSIQDLRDGSSESVKQALVTKLEVPVSDQEMGHGKTREQLLDNYLLHVGIAPDSVKLVS